MDSGYKNFTRLPDLTNDCFPQSGEYDELQSKSTPNDMTCLTKQEALSFRNPKSTL